MFIAVLLIIVKKSENNLNAYQQRINNDFFIWLNPNNQKSEPEQHVSKKIHLYISKLNWI